LASISRCVGVIVDDAHKTAVGKSTSILAQLRDIELLVRIGQYKRGSDPVTDEAIDRVDGRNNLFKNRQKEWNTFDETRCSN
jgi:type III secretion protein N (ATPase)